MKKSKECKHKYKQYGRTCLPFYGRKLPGGIKRTRVKRNPRIFMQCTKCGDRLERPMTKEEKQKYGKEDREGWKESTRLHKVWHKFVDTFYDNTTSRWKYQGYKFMCKVEAYARRNKSIVVTCCDDAAHAGADLVLVPHRNKEGYWGTTVMYISQANVQPTVFFLYPEHETDFRKALAEVKKKTWK
jgi:hypothetical protein